MSLGGTFVDPDPDQTHVVTINWGDGSQPTSVDLAAGVFSFSDVTHTYTANSSAQPSGVFTVSAFVTDQPGAIKSNGRCSDHGSLERDDHDRRFLGQPFGLRSVAVFSATVSRATATGTVDFYDGTTEIGSGTLNGITGITTFTTTSLAVGSHAITASYEGDANDGPSTSSPLNQVVNPNTGVALTISNTAPFVGQKVTLKATVSVLSPGTEPKPVP